MINKTLNPRWDAAFLLRGDFDALCRDFLRVSAWDHDSFGTNDRLGDGVIDLKLHLLGLGRRVNVEVDLNDGQAIPGRLHLAMRWENAAIDSSVGTMHARLLSAEGLRAADRNGLSDPYVKLSLGEQQLRSTTVKRTLAPRFEEDFYFHAASIDHLVGNDLSVEVYDHDVLSRDDVLGICSVSCDSQGIRCGECIRRTITLMGGTAKQACGTITLALEWHPPARSASSASAIGSERLLATDSLSVTTPPSKPSTATTVVPAGSASRKLPPPTPLPAPADRCAPTARPLLLLLLVVVLLFAWMVLKPALGDHAAPTTPTFPPPMPPVPSMPPPLPPPSPPHPPSPPSLPPWFGESLWLGSLSHYTMLRGQEIQQVGRDLLLAGQSMWRKVQALWRMEYARWVVVIAGSLVALKLYHDAVSWCLDTRSHYNELTERESNVSNTKEATRRPKSTRGRATWFKRSTHYIHLALNDMLWDVRSVPSTAAQTRRDEYV